MRIHEILLEFNKERLNNDFGKKLLARAAADNSAPKVADPSQLISAIAAFDKTPNKDLTFWLVNNYVNSGRENYNGGIKRFEDIGSRAVPELLKFKSLLNKPNLTPKLPVRDINQIKGLVQLETMLDSYTEKDTTSNSQQDQMYFDTSQAILVYNDSQVKVIVPKTKAASCYFGINTKWCTASKTNNMFDAYNQKGPLYIVLIKADNRRYQFHFQVRQFMDESDQEINPNDLANKYPILWKIFGPIAKKLKVLPLNADPSKQVQLAAVKEDGSVIKYINNPTEQVQLAAVREYGSAIQYIKNPTEPVQLAAVREDGSVMQYIKNPGEQVQLAAVSQDGWVIRVIDNPSEQVQLAAVKEDGSAIQYIKNPSEQVQLAAVKDYGPAIKYINNPSEAVKLAIKLKNKVK